MGEINLSNSKNRDAVVATHSVRIPLKVRWVDEQGRQASTARLLKASLDKDIAALQKADYEEKLAALTGRVYVAPRGGADDD